jgi:histidine triad (HIT) family protein
MSVLPRATRLLRRVEPAQRHRRRHRPRIAPKWWPGNQGSVLVITREHVENLYALSPEDNHAVWDLVRKLAIAVRSTYACEGTSVRQHNEPAGDQDLWHLHVHVFPRHQGDNLYRRHGDARWVDAAERAEYATRLRRVLGMPTTFQTRAVPGKTFETGGE